MELESLDLALEDFGVLEYLIALGGQGLRLRLEPGLRLLRRLGPPLLDVAVDGVTRLRIEALPDPLLQLGHVMRRHLCSAVPGFGEP